jgi:cytidine deaminase
VTDIDWDELIRLAVAAAQNAYAPYSNFPVGAAGLVDDGRVVAGCNVENASLGLSLCAECGMVSELHASGGGRLVAVVTRKGDGDPVLPCGRCRQVLFEFGGADLLVDGTGEPRRLGELIVDAFGPDDLSGNPSDNPRDDLSGNPSDPSSDR